MSRFHFEDLMPDACRKPLNRTNDVHEDPINRAILYGPGIISGNPEALRLVTKAYAEDPDKAKGLMPYLYGESAITATDNYVKATREAAKRIDASNNRHEQAIARLDKDLKTLTAKEMSLAVELAQVSAVLPMKPKGEEAAFDFADDEPETLEATAARSGVLPPLPIKEAPKWILCIAGAAFLAAGYGPLVQAGDFQSISEKPLPYVVLFVAAGLILLMISAFLEAVMQLIGAQAERRAQTSSRRHQKTERWLIGFVLVTTFLTIASESTTERVGIFQSLQTRAGSMTASAWELQWIVMLVVVPTVCLAIVKGFRAGCLAVINSELVRARDIYRESLRKSDEFAKSSALHAEYRQTRQLREKLEAERNKRRDAIRFEFNKSELHYLEDIGNEAIGASLRTEGSFEFAKPSESGKAARVIRRPRRGWFSLLGALLSRRFKNAFVRPR